MHWYWWVLTFVVGLPVLSITVFFIILRFFTPPGDLALSIIGKEKKEINWLDALLWPIAWFIYKICEDC
jgi:hypothetical protein